MASLRSAHIAVLRRAVTPRCLHHASATPRGGGLTSASAVVVVPPSRGRGVVVLGAAHGRLASSATSAANEGAAEDEWTAKRLVGATIFGGLVAGTFGLGVWQTKRYFWKQSIIDARESGLRAPPVPTTVGEARAAFDSKSAAANAEWETTQRIVVRGTFDATRQVRVGPRSPPPGLLAREASGMATGPLGFEIVAAFRGDDGTECLVNRGWAPKTWAEKTTNAEASEQHTRAGPVELVCVARRGERKGSFSPQNTPDHVLWLELPFVAKLLGVPTHDTDDFLLVALADDDDGDDKRASSTTKADSWPRARSARQLLSVAVDPPTHAVYAFTWFAMSIAGAILTRRLLFPTAAAKRGGPRRR